MASEQGLFATGAPIRRLPVQEVLAKTCRITGCRIERPSRTSAYLAGSTPQKPSLREPIQMTQH